MYCRNLVLRHSDSLIQAILLPSMQKERQQSSALCSPDVSSCHIIFLSGEPLRGDAAVDASRDEHVFVQRATCRLRQQRRRTFAACNALFDKTPSSRNRSSPNPAQQLTTFLPRQVKIFSVEQNTLILYIKTATSYSLCRGKSPRHCRQPTP